MEETIILKQMLNQYNITPTKKFGQNFLVNNDIVNKIIRSLGNVRNKNLLEIGPGIGVLTKNLLRTDLKSLTTIEIDKKFIPVLHQIKSRTSKNFHIINDSALKIQEANIIDGRYTIVANLPYGISTLLIVKWIKKLHLIDKIIVMLQKEVADRITAQVSTQSYGRLSVLVQFVCDYELLFNVDPESFFPVPKVTSSMIQLKPKKKLPTIKEINNIEKICKLLFSFRRKKIKKSLQHICKNPKDDLDRLKIDSNKRCEQLTVNEFFKIAKKYLL